MNVQKETKVIKVDAEDSAYLEAISFDLGAHRSLVEFMINGGADVKSEGFARYHDKYRELYMTFELAKKELEVKYLGDWREKCDWNLDYATQEIIAVKVK